MPPRINRRSFLGISAVAGVVSALPSAVCAGPVAATAAVTTAASRPLRLLILGGTRFVGPALVRAALARGHEVTLFNRGITRAWLFPGVEQRRGNRYPERDDGLRALRTGSWDAVFDLPAYFPRIVEASADLLKGRVGHYVVMSSISVYRDFTRVGIDETAPLRTLDRDYEERQDLREDYEFGTYGARKVLCEQAAFERFPGAATTVRACGIGGGGLSDATKWYWPARLRRDARLAAPGDGEDPVQWVDRRDVADFLVRVAERKLIGAYNVTGPRGTLREVLDTTARIVGGKADIVWVGNDHPEIRRRVPSAPPRDRVPGFAAISSAKARAAGFRDRPFADTIAADWLWFREHHPLDFDFHAANVGVSAEEEARILAAVLGA